jgi:hypothetical protein
MQQRARFEQLSVALHHDAIYRYDTDMTLYRWTLLRRRSALVRLITHGVRDA